MSESQEVKASALEEEVRLRPKLHTLKDAKKVLRVLRGARVRAHLIGSLGMGYASAHDIDILFCGSDISFKPTNRAFLDLFKPSRYALTNHNSLYLRHTFLGTDVEIFFGPDSDDTRI